MIDNSHCLVMMRASSKTYAFRAASIFMGLASAVAAVLWLTPMPDPFFLSCDRPCHALEWPMICRFKLTLEVYQTLSRSCGDCPKNQTDCFTQHCVTADGYERGLLTANRQLPGPSLQVCENDILVVDVTNRIPGHGLTIHWRGMPQKSSPFMDGVPMVSQCPIPTYTTFQYKFRASKAGTHLWHAYSGTEMADGIFGTLIVRKAKSLDPHRDLYDVDDPSHVITVAEWTHGFAIQRLIDGQGSHGSIPDSLLVNGRGKVKRPDSDEPTAVPYNVFTVTPNIRHRFRLAHAGVMSCPVRLSVDDHSLLIISLDGNPTRPKEVSSIVLSSGERVDFVLRADKKVSSYWLRVTTLPDCDAPKPLVQGAIIMYKGATKEQPKGSLPVHPKTPSRLMLPNSISGSCEDDDNALCVMEMESLQKMDSELAAERMDKIVHFSYDFKLVANENVTFSSFMVSREKFIKVPHINNKTFMFPSSPLVSQASDVPPDMMCTEEYESPRCKNSDEVCECVHQIDIPLGATVELILVDEGRGSDKSHVFHLHGYSFHVVAMARLGHPVTLDEVKSLDKRGLIERNLINPVVKDTITIPNKGYAVIRFKANNPGYWLMHDQHASHSTWGLNAILHVGTHRELPSAPSDFPRCGSWIGPYFFLA